METTEKFEIWKLKDEIKKMSEEQRFLKNQRKDVHIKGERKMPTKEATWKHQVNREQLRIMFAAYGLMRGKTFSQIENHYPEEEHPLNQFKTQIDGVLLKYTIKETV
jgi:hypothetical protein